MSYRELVRAMVKCAPSPEGTPLGISGNPGNSGDPGDRAIQAIEKSGLFPILDIFSTMWENRVS
jgi:hypothetical protein